MPLEASLSSSKAQMAKAEAALKRVESEGGSFRGGWVKVNAVSKQVYETEAGWQPWGRTKRIYWRAKGGVQTADKLNLGYTQSTRRFRSNWEGPGDRRRFSERDGSDAASGDSPA